MSEDSSPLSPEEAEAIALRYLQNLRDVGLETVAEYYEIGLQLGMFHIDHTDGKITM